MPASTASSGSLDSEKSNRTMRRFLFLAATLDDAQVVGLDVAMGDAGALEVVHDARRSLPQSCNHSG